MCRRLVLALVSSIAALLAGCGDDSPTRESSPAASDADSAAGPASDPAVDAPTVPSDCPPPTEDTVSVASFPEGKPAVEIPSVTPTDLVITDLIEGTGNEAETGDVVTVNYVGVRTADGTEFDNSYDRDATFPVTLGQDSVIDGWERGLIGIKQGGRRQLDIPSELAYGDAPPGDIIQAGDALTFVIDAVSVVDGPPVADPADAPVVEIPTSVGATELVITDLIEGDRCLIAQAGNTVFIHAILYRGDTGAELQSSWTTGQAIELPLDDTAIAGLVDGVVGMGVGGRRLVIVPPALGFGAEASASIGLEADADAILVIDLVQLG